MKQGASAVYGSYPCVVICLVQFRTQSLRTQTRTESFVIDIVFSFYGALRSRCGHYICALWCLLSIYPFSSPNLSGRRVDVYHTSTHGVALVRI